MAEMGYDGALETLPFNQVSFPSVITKPDFQARESRIMWLLEYYAMAPLYWRLLLRLMIVLYEISNILNNFSGWWEGPTIVRKIMHGGFGK